MNVHEITDSIYLFIERIIFLLFLLQKNFASADFNHIEKSLFLENLEVFNRENSPKAK